MSWYLFSHSCEAISRSCLWDRIEDLINIAGRFSIKKAATILKRFCWFALLGVIFLIQTEAVTRAAPPREIQVPNTISPGLVHLLNLADPNHQEAFRADKITKLLAYMEESKDPGAIYVTEAALGSPSGYYEFDIRQNFEHLLKYTFHPEIPSYLMTPSCTRLSHWEQIHHPDKRLPAWWDTLHQLDEPRTVGGIEFVENTPDMVSGAYYGYHLYRTLILFKANQRNVIISVSKQTDRSDVGKKGYVLGSDDNWDYFYSGKPGLTIPGLGWVRSYMYDSYGVSIYYELDAAAPLLRCSIFRWVRAGWSGINAVKKHHIHDGIKRFAKSYKAIMEYPDLPGINQFSDIYSKITALPEKELRDRIKIYLSILENRYGSHYRPSRALSPLVFQDKGPWFQMAAEAMRSVLMQEYLKAVMGKTSPKLVGPLLEF
jgi:hypothetical protein